MLLLFIPLWPTASEPHQFMESLLEVLVGHGVDDGIDERVQITQPVKEVKELRKEAGVTRGHHQSVNEKG